MATCKQQADYPCQRILGRDSTRTVFLDTRSIPIGTDWKQYFTESIGNAPVLVLLGHGRLYRDYYRVEVDWESRSNWNEVLIPLKREFLRFQCDVLQHKMEDGSIRKFGTNSTSNDGSILAAVNLALNPFDKHYIDRDLLRTGLSIVVITPGTGIFQVDEKLWRLTSERMVDNGVCLDLVCLSKPPLYTVPLFQFLSKDIPMQTDFSDQLGIGIGGGGGPLERRASAKRPDSQKVTTPMGPRSAPNLEISKLFDDAFLHKDGHIRQCSTIPHWIDCSFWDWQRTRSMCIPLMNPYADTDSPTLEEGEALDNFTLRCKMTGIMDLESRVIVPYLDPHKITGASIDNHKVTINEQVGVDIDWYDESVFSNRGTKERVGLTVGRSQFEDQQPFQTQFPKPPSVVEEYLQPKPYNLNHLSVSPRSGLVRPISGLSLSIRSAEDASSSIRPSIDGNEIAMISENEEHVFGSTNLEPIRIKSEKADRIHSFDEFRGGFHGGKSFGSSNKSSQLQPLDITRIHDGRLSPAKARSYISSSFGSRGINFVNPCSVKSSKLQLASQLQQWRYISPRFIDPNSGVPYTNWKSLCTPACLPLTTDYDPGDELISSYKQHIYMLTPSSEDSSPFLPYQKGNVDDHKKAELLFFEIISQRLAHGFQIIITAETTSEPTGLKNSHIMQHQQDQQQPIFTTNKPLFLSLGDDFHQIYHDPTGTTVEVRRYVKPTPFKRDPVEYTCRIWPKNTEFYRDKQVKFTYPKLDDNKWNDLDQLLSGYHDKMEEKLQYWRTRFILIPIEKEKLNALEVIPQHETLDEQEKRNAGFEKFVEFFEKSQWISAAEREEIRKQKQGIQEKSVSNIEFTTDILSVYVRDKIGKQSSGLDVVIKDQSPVLEFDVDVEGKRVRSPDVMFSDVVGDKSPNFERRQSIATLFPAMSDYNMLSGQLKKTATIEEISSVVYHTVSPLPITNRKWNFKEYERVFLGKHAVDWMIRNFSDIITREDAVQFGNELLARGFFEHVNKRHQFLDGHYFYRLSRNMGNFGSNTSPSHHQHNPSTDSEKSNRNGSGSSGEIADGVASPTPVRQIPLPDEILSRSFANKVGGGIKRTGSSASSNKAYPKKSDYAFANLSSSYASATSGTSLSSNSVFDSHNSTLKYKPVPLTKKMVIDLDPQGLSVGRREVAILHFDTVYNMKLCYHLQLHWLMCSARLLEDMLQQWSQKAEKYGLKLVEAPVEQAVPLEDDNPFQSVISIKLVKQPPPLSVYVDRLLKKARKLVSAVPYLWFEAELVKFHGYVLDMEADASQYAHRTGVAFIQLCDEGDGFLFVKNRLLGAAVGLPEKSSSRVTNINGQNSPEISPDYLRERFASFCADENEEFLRFQSDVLPHKIFYIDRDLLRTGLSIVVITPGTGIFKVDEKLWWLTSERMVDNGVCLDLVCLAEPSLYTVPLFQFLSKDIPMQPDFSDQLEAVDRWKGELPRNGQIHKRSRLQWVHGLHPIWEISKFFDEAFLHKDGHIRQCSTIPHWIDCTFWDWQRTRSMCIPLMNPYADTDTPTLEEGESLDSFTLRCKMTGIMDLESRVIVPYLDPHKITGASIDNHKVTIKEQVGVDIDWYDESVFSNRSRKERVGLTVGRSQLEDQQPFQTQFPKPPSVIEYGFVRPISGLSLSLRSAEDASSSIRPSIDGNEIAMISANEEHVFGSTKIEPIRIKSEKADRIHSFDEFRGGVHGGKSFGSSNKTKTRSYISSSFGSKGINFVNPCSVKSSKLQLSSQLQQWRYISPRFIDPNSGVPYTNWKSLCTPACLPLTTDYDPGDELISSYKQHIYMLTPSSEDSSPFLPYQKGNVDDHKKAELLFFEIISQRLAHGFQIITAENTSETTGLKNSHIVQHQQDQQQPIFTTNKPLFLSLGDDVHQIYHDPTGTTVEVRRYVKPSPFKRDPVEYTCRIWPKNTEFYRDKQVKFTYPKLDDNKWNDLDQLLSGYHDKMEEKLRYWRTRFILIPMEKEKLNALEVTPQHETLDEQEKRIAGFEKFVEFFEKSRWISSAEREEIRKQKQGIQEKSVSNIEFTTDVLSVYVRDKIGKQSSGLDSPVLEFDVDVDGKRVRSPDDLFSDVVGDKSPMIERRQSLATLFAAMKTAIIEEISSVVYHTVSPLPITNQKCNFKEYERVFLGKHAVDWTIRNFSDIITRENAVQFGNELLARGFFEHVNKRHQFLDGHYFYRLSRNMGNFGSNTSPSHHQHNPSTDSEKSNRNGSGSSGGIADGIASPTPVRQIPLPDEMLSRSFTNKVGGGIKRTGSSASSNKAYPKKSDYAFANLSSSYASATSGTSLSSNSVFDSHNSTLKYKPVPLTKKMVIDLDPQGLSVGRREVAILHFDTVYNTKLCYHLQLHWLMCSARLLEDMLQQWSQKAEKYGLKLVEAPVEQAVPLEDDNPFQSVISITLVKQPPPLSVYVDRLLKKARKLVSAVPYLWFEAELVKFHGYVLDMEADARFPPNSVDFSYKKPNYRYSQYAHRSGVAFIQLCDEGDGFLFVKNRLLGAAVGLPEKSSSRVTNINGQNSPEISPDYLRERFASFCADENELEKFWMDCLEKLASIGNISLSALLSDNEVDLEEGEMEELSVFAETESYISVEYDSS
ncbi:vacuolar membrane-associated protein iml1 [Nowakowskiella sp. JEL0407]|nr:vacuolar membrane-associated protein iml1 [Nowakowskiella sp. JEL0407]